MPDQIILTTRTTEPDQAAIVATLRANVDPDIRVWWANESRYRLTKATAWTAPQVAAAQTAIDTAPELTPTLRYTRTSREKDVLATVALVVRRAVGIATWNGWTAQQKRDAVLAEADVWVNIREFLEANVP